MPAEQHGSTYRTNTAWGVRWYEDGRRRFKSGFETKTAARAYFRDIVAPVLRGEAPTAESGDIVLSAYVDAFLAGYADDHEPRTVRSVRERLGYALRVFGDVTLRELERHPEKILPWKSTLPGGTRYDILVALRQVLDQAVRLGKIRRNPVRVAVPKIERPRRATVQPFTVEQVDRIAAELGAWAPLVTFAAETGLRPSEWLALRWGDVDADTGLVTVHQTYTSDGVKAYGKTDGSTRSVPLARRAVRALEQQRERHEQESRRRGQLSPLVFTSWQGGGSRHGAGHLNLNNWRKRDWYPALDAAGLTKRGPYALRHSFATMALAAGIGIFELARYMGTSVEMIDVTYGHLVADHADVARAKLDAYAGAVQASAGV